MNDGTHRRLAEAILVAHQRRDSESCLCGRLRLGESWAAHVADVLDAAGALMSPPVPPRSMMTEKDVAARLGVTVTSLRRWRQDGYGPPVYRLGGSLRYRPEEVSEWITDQMETPHD